MTRDEYLVRLKELAEIARLHRFGQPHPMPSRACPDCQQIARWQRELVRRRLEQVMRMGDHG